MGAHLKSKQHYIDLYDRQTVERCRKAEKNWNEKELPPYRGKDLNAEAAGRMKSMFSNLRLLFETGERYSNKEETIRVWMSADQKKDELYESAQAPEGIRCLSCRNVLKPTFKDLWSRLDKPDRVLFMYDCVNKCLPRRAFFSDGEEWRTEPDLCPRCGKTLSQEAKNSEEKLITAYVCSPCSYTKTDELVWTQAIEEPYDENFATDRDRFCLSEEKGKEYINARYNLEQLGDTLKEVKEIEKARVEKLKANPRGFHLEERYSCAICGDCPPAGDIWYDEWGMKCLVCQKAIDKGEIPPMVAKDEDSWYSGYDMESRFNIKSPTWRKWIRQGILKARTITKYGTGIHKQLFLVEDNKEFLPPKELTGSQGVVKVKDGKEWHTSEPWYRFVGAIERVKDYGIMKLFKIVQDEKVNKDD